jgi:hypothetical protein
LALLIFSPDLVVTRLGLGICELVDHDERTDLYVIVEDFCHASEFHHYAFGAMHLLDDYASDACESGCELRA